jgi:aspartyl-tRNA(Asn)/glutamyl-tRNA(Gln) amidotransferase subunit A
MEFPLAGFPREAADISQAVRSGKINVAEVAQVYLEQSQKHQDNLNAFIHFDSPLVEREVERVSQLVSQSKVGLPLAGVPIAIKDNICVTDRPMTCGSKILNGFRPSYNATVVEKLKNAGCLLFSKSNMDEFAMGSSSENSAFGAVKNPWDLSRVPGGSSGGSAAAVAAEMVPVALGSDTGGSIRQPASFCGIVGFKPTYGRVSRYGLTAYASSLDQIGPLTRTVKDAALIFDVISGHDPKDSTSLKQPPSSYFSSLDGNPTRKTIGVIKELFDTGIDSDVKASLTAALDVFRQQGADIVEVSIPELEYAIATYYIIATAEASSNLSRFDGVRYGHRADNVSDIKNLYEKSRSEGFGREVIQRIMLGSFVLSAGYLDAFYGKATRVRGLLGHKFDEAFKKVDLLFAPTAPSVAFKIGEKTNDPLSMYLSDICTIAVNLAGIPAISVPCGYGRDNLPIGLQLIAARGNEQQLFEGAYLYEQATGWLSAKRPTLL